MGIDPKKWGPSLWKFLHYVSFNYPDNPSNNDKHVMRNFIYVLGDILPCESCRNHYRENIGILMKSQGILNNRESLIKFFYDLHNMVNNIKGTPEYSYSKFVRDYDMEGRECNSCKELFTGNSLDISLGEFEITLIIISCIIFIIIIGYIIYYKTKSKKRNYRL